MLQTAPLMRSDSNWCMSASVFLTLFDRNSRSQWRQRYRNDDIVRKTGGHFKLCALIQRRWLELIQGARPMVETKGMTDMEVIVQEIMEDKITLVVTPGFETEEDAES